MLLGALTLAGLGGSALAVEAPDANLFTTYEAGTGYQNFYYFVCGSTQESLGCYGFGSLGTFGRAGAILEGDPSVSGNTVTRNIYVVDLSPGGGDGVSLVVYKKTDSVSASNDTVTVTHTATIPLALVGGPAATAYIAGNSDFLYVGTSKSDYALQIRKGSYATIQTGFFEPAIPVSGISSDSHGNVTITFSSPGSTFSGFYSYAANGQELGDGGGSEFMVSNTTGTSTGTAAATPPLAIDPTTLAAKMVVRPKPSAP